LHYAVNLTGHGWRKLMRLDAPFVYRVDDVGDPGPLFRFMQQAGPLAAREAYGTFNMGAGFAVMVAEPDAERALGLARGAGFTAWRAGRVARDGARKAVELAPLGLTYDAASLGVR
jgi:phosphoribosylformylglycinamidine cyclo-ligase